APAGRARRPGASRFVECGQALSAGRRFHHDLRCDRTVITAFASDFSTRDRDRSDQLNGVRVQRPVMLDSEWSAGFARPPTRQLLTVTPIPYSQWVNKTDKRRRQFRFVADLAIEACRLQAGRI